MKDLDATHVAAATWVASRSFMDPALAETS